MFLFPIKEIPAQNNSCSFLCNSDFENVQVVSPGSYVLVPSTSVPCWQTTATDEIIEVWGTGYVGVPAYSGNQFVELNANMVSTLYQNFQAIPGSSVNISFAHRGRNGTDVMSVSIGPVGGTYTDLGNFSSDNTAWDLFTINYSFPNNGITQYTLRFNSISSAGGHPKIGNFLDAITIYLPAPEMFFTKIDVSCNSNNDGSISVVNTGGTPPYTYNWQPPQNGTTFINNLEIGNYTLKLTDSYGCETVDSINIAKKVQTVISVNSDTICKGDTAILTAIGSTNYIWSTGTVANYITVSPSASTFYTVTTIDGCSDTVFANVTVNPLPTVNLGADTVTCFSSVTLNAGNSNNSYLWSNGQTTPSITLNASGQYSVVVTNNFGCSASDTINVLVNTLPQINLGNDISVCADTTITLNAGNGFVNYLWSNGVNTQTITPTQSGQYYVTVIDTNSCTNGDTINIVYNPLPNINLGIDTTYCRKFNLFSEQPTNLHSNFGNLKNREDLLSTTRG